MALINCPECNKQISDRAESCPHCGYPLQQQPVYTNSYGVFGKTLYYPRCGSSNLSHHYETVGYTTIGHEETHKKSIITRAGNSLGRTGMILATGGLWALTPKKSKYHTTQTSTTQARRARVLNCNNCGYSWER